MNQPTGQPGSYPNGPNPHGSGPYGSAPQQYGPGPQQYGSAPPPHGPAAPQYGPGPQQYGPGPQQYGPGPDPYGAAPQQYGSAPPLPQPSRSSRGKIIGIIAGVVVVLAGLGVAALLLFGTKTLDESKVRSEIVRVTQEGSGLAPNDVRCPDSIPVKSGEVTTCTAQLDGQPVSYQVRQTDDKGNIFIQSGGFVVTDKIEKTLAEQVGQKTSTAVTADCADGKKVVVGGKGTTISCTVTNTADSSDTLQVTATVTDEQGSVEFS